MAVAYHGRSNAYRQQGSAWPKIVMGAKHYGKRRRIFIALATGSVYEGP